MKIRIRSFRAHWKKFVFPLFIFFDAWNYTAKCSDRSSTEANVVSTHEPAFNAPHRPLSYDSEITWYTAAELIGPSEIRSSAESRYGVKLSDDRAKREVHSVFDYGGIFDIDVPLETVKKYGSEQPSYEPNHRFRGAETAHSQGDFVLDFLRAGFPNGIGTPIEWFACVAICAGCLYLLFKVFVIRISPLPTWLLLRLRLFVPEAPLCAEKIDARLARARMVLGVNPKATPEEIKSAYRNLIKKYHPDVYAGSLPELQHIAHEKAKELNEAYSYLNNERNPA